MTSNNFNRLVITKRAEHLPPALTLMLFAGTGNQKMQSRVHSVKQRESRLVGRHKDTVFPSVCCTLRIKSGSVLTSAKQDIDIIP